MTDDEVQEALVRWLTTFTGVQTIKARQGIKRPDGAYLMVEKGTVEELYDNPNHIDYDELTSENSEGFNEIKATPIVELEWLMLVFSFGEGQSRALRKVKQAVYLQQIQEALSVDAEGQILPMVLNIHDTGVINSIPEFVDQRWEPRSQLNVMLRGVSSDGFVIDTVDRHSPFNVERT